MFFQELMYKDTSRFACLFQSYVQLTMTQLHALNTQKPYKIMERSAYSARLFIENMKRNKTLKDVELYVLEAWYDWSIENSGIETDLIGKSKFSILLIFAKNKGN